MSADRMSDLDKLSNLLADLKLWALRAVATCGPGDAKYIELCMELYLDICRFEKSLEDSKNVRPRKTR